jgi:hypothetical protein
VRRKNFFLGTTVVGAVLSAIYAFLLSLLSVAEKATGGWGVKLDYFRIPWLSDVPVAGWAWMMFVLFLNLFFLGLVFAAWHRRFGRTSLFALLAIVITLLGVGAVLCTYFGRWDDLFGWLRPLSPTELFSWLIAPTALYALLSYLLLRKAMA